MTSELDVGFSFDTKKCGKATITETLGNGIYKITFNNTGHSVHVRKCQIKSGSIKDRTAPSICGVGIIGDHNSKHPLYPKWVLHLKSTKINNQKAYVVFDDYIKRYNKDDK